MRRMLNVKQVESEVTMPFCLLFCTSTRKDFHQNVYIECRCVIGQRKYTVCRVSVHLSARKFYRLDSEGVNAGVILVATV